MFKDEWRKGEKYKYILNVIHSLYTVDRKWVREIQTLCPND